MFTRIFECEEDMWLIVCATLFALAIAMVVVVLVVLLVLVVVQAFVSIDVAELQLDSPTNSSSAFSGGHLAFAWSGHMPSGTMLRPVLAVRPVASFVFFFPFRSPLIACCA